MTSHSPISHLVPPDGASSATAALSGLVPPPLVAHGRLPIDVGEWALFAVAAVVCAWVLWKAVRYSIHPGEEAPDHVKRSILDSDAGAFGPSTGVVRPLARGIADGRRQ